MIECQIIVRVYMDSNEMAVFQDRISVVDVATKEGHCILSIQVFTRQLVYNI